MDDVDILRELCRSVYLTTRQRSALRRVVALVGRAPHRRPEPKVESADRSLGLSNPSVCGTCEGCVRGESCSRPLLGPGDAE